MSPAEKPKHWDGTKYVPVPSSRAALAALIDAKKAHLKAFKLRCEADAEAEKAKRIEGKAADEVTRVKSLLEAALVVEVAS